MSRFIRNGKIFLLTFAVIIFVWMFFQFPTPSFLEGPVAFLADIMRPVLMFGDRVRGGVEDVGKRVHFFWSEPGEQKRLLQLIAQLELDNESLRRRLSQYEDLTNVRFTLTSREKLLPAQIIAFDPLLTSKTITIDLGRAEGVQINQPVMAVEGLVGKIVAVYEHSSRVLLIIDPQASVDAKNKRTDVRCLISGMNLRGLRAARMPFLTQVEYENGSHEMQPGDELITSGIGGIFPAGLKIGTILSIKFDEKNLFDKAVVAPAVDFAKLDQVYVLTQIIP